MIHLFNTLTFSIPMLVASISLLLIAVWDAFMN